MIVNKAPVFSSNERTSCSGTNAPPALITVIVDRSVESNRGCSRMPTYNVGTPSVAFTP
jgi:hypothetical protein